MCVCVRERERYRERCVGFLLLAACRGHASINYSSLKTKLQGLYFYCLLLLSYCRLIASSIWMYICCRSARIPVRETQVQQRCADSAQRPQAVVGGQVLNPVPAKISKYTWSTRTAMAGDQKLCDCSPGVRRQQGNIFLFLSFRLN